MKGKLIGILIHSPLRAGVPIVGGTFNYEKNCYFFKAFLAFAGPYGLTSSLYIN